MWYVFTVEYYSATENSEVKNFVGKWMKLEKNHPEETQIRKEKCVIYIPLYVDVVC